MTIRDGGAEKVTSEYDATLCSSSFRRKPETIFSYPNHSLMDAVFQRHDVRDGSAKKVTSVSDVTAEIRHSGEGRKPSSLTPTISWMPFFNGMNDP